MTGPRGIYRVWAFRMWLSERLLKAGIRVEPDYQSRRYVGDNGWIHLWCEPTFEISPRVRRRLGWPEAGE